MLYRFYFSDHIREPHVSKIYFPADYFNDLNRYLYILPFVEPIFFTPSRPNPQHFVSAKVDTIIDENVFEDDLAPGIYRGTQHLKVTVLTGEHANESVEINNPLSRQHNVLLNKGSEFILLIRETLHGSHLWAFNHQRSTAIYTMSAVFIGLIFIFGGRAGLHAIISLYFTAALIIGVLIPAIFNGINPALITIVLMAIKIIINFILVSGYNKKSLCAILGTLVGVIMAGIFAQLFGEWAHLSGIYLDKGEDVIYLAANKPIQIRWLMFVTIMIAALGTRNGCGNIYCFFLSRTSTSQP